MLLRSIGAALLTVGAAQGFKNSSPFLMLSTYPGSKDGLQSAVVNTADKVTDAILAAVGDCDQNKYYILQQPGLTVADLQSDAASSLRTWSNSAAFEQHIKIDNVMGEVDADDLARKIANRCGAGEVDGEFPQHGLGAGTMFIGEDKEVDLVKMEPLSGEAENRAQAVAELHNNLAHFGPDPSDDHMIIILAAPITTLNHAAEVYEMDEPYPSALHQDLKRDIKFEPLKSSNSSDSNKHMQDGLPLFEKYQFLSPGIFMGLTVSLLLLVILWVGVSAIAGLEVSYMAFSKEMGPAAQNKGKQQ